MLDLRTTTWGTFTQNSDVIALICPSCAAMVTVAVDPQNGISGKEAHIAWHERVGV